MYVSCVFYVGTYNDDVFLCTLEYILFTVFAIKHQDYRCNVGTLQYLTVSGCFTLNRVKTRTNRIVERNRTKTHTCLVTNLEYCKVS